MEWGSLKKAIGYLLTAEFENKYLYHIISYVA